MIVIVIEKEEGGSFVVGETTQGALVGRGRTMDAAMADWLRVHATRLAVVIEVADTAVPAELARRRREMAKR